MSKKSADPSETKEFKLRVVTDYFNAHKMKGPDFDKLAEREFEDIYKGIKMYHIMNYLKDRNLLTNERYTCDQYEQIYLSVRMHELKAWRHREPRQLTPTERMSLLTGAGRSDLQ